MEWWNDGMLVSKEPNITLPPDIAASLSAAIQEFLRAELGVHAKNR